MYNSIKIECCCTISTHHYHERYLVLRISYPDMTVQPPGREAELSPGTAGCYVTPGRPGSLLIEGTLEAQSLFN